MTLSHRTKSQPFSDSIFTEKSDVWSYGVCLWEMLTLGSTPYSTVENNELESYLESGKRLRISSFVPEKLENLINKIWAFEAKGRVAGFLTGYKLKTLNYRI